MKRAEIPIAIEGGLIVVDARIAGNPVRLVLDTAAGSNLLAPPLAARLRLTGTKVQVGGAGAERRDALMTTVPDIECGGQRVERQPAVVLALPEGGPNAYDGILGTPFLSRFVVRIDYAARSVAFLAPGEFAPPAGAAAVPLTLRLSIPEVPAVIDGISGPVRLDTGFAGTLTFTSAAVARHRLNERYPRRLGSVAGVGVGGASREEVTRVDRLALGGFALSGVVAGLSTDTGGALADPGSLALVGGSVLSRFRLTFDYPGRRLFLEKGPRFDQPFVYPRSGFAGEIVGEQYRVLSVIPGGPAEEAGLAVGESVLSVDGMPVKALGLSGVRARSLQPVGTRLRLEVRGKDGAVRTITLTLREML